MIKAIKYLVIVALKRLKVANRIYKYYKKIGRVLPSGCDVGNINIRVEFNEL